MRDPMTADLRARVARIVDGLDDAACAMTWGTFARPRDPNIVLNLDPFLSVADIKALLAALDAADKDGERIDAFDVFTQCQDDLSPYLTIARGGSLVMLDVKRGGCRPLAQGQGFRALLDSYLAARPHPEEDAPMGSEREKKFSRAWKRYERARAKAWDAFDAIEGPAWQEYENAIRYHDMEKIPTSDPEPTP